jgi:ATP-dependent Clp protease protease subunit
MIHQPEGAYAGQASDIEIHAKEVLTIREVLNEVMAKHTGQSVDKIAKDTDRNFFMSSDAAKKYGIIDEIMEKRAK